MRDYKCYLPHHRIANTPKNRHHGMRSTLASIVAITILLSVLAHAAVLAVVQQQEIAEAKVMAAKAERHRIIAAVSRDVADQERYQAYLRQVVAKAYGNDK